MPSKDAAHPAEKGPLGPCLYLDQLSKGDKQPGHHTSICKVGAQFDDVSAAMGIARQDEADDLILHEEGSVSDTARHIAVKKRNMGGSVVVRDHVEQTAIMPLARFLKEAYGTDADLASTGAAHKDRVSESRAATIASTEVVRKV